MKSNFQQIINNDIFLEGKLIEKIELGEYNPEMACKTLWNINLHFALNLDTTKEGTTHYKLNFSNCGRLDEYMIKNYNSRIPDYGIRHICMPILSDNEDLIKRYAQLRYEKHPIYAPKSMDEMVEIGDTAITFNTIQHFMINNLEGVQHNLRLYEKYKSKILRNSPTLEIDYRFFNALLAKDKIKMEESIYELLVPKVHKRRNDSPVLAEIVSLPALAYTKLAWRYGIEVEIDSPLIPRDLLPIKPLDVYEIPYDFLR